MSPWENRAWLEENLATNEALGSYFESCCWRAADALRLGADEVVISKNPGEVQKHAGTFDFILDTVSANHDLNVYINLLKMNGTMTLVGAPDNPAPVSAFSLIFGRRRLAGSAIGGIRETQEMLDFCAENRISADIEMIKIQQIDQAYDRLLKSARSTASSQTWLH